MYEGWSSLEGEIVFFCVHFIDLIKFTFVVYEYQEH